MFMDTEQLFLRAMDTELEHEPFGFRWVISDRSEVSSGSCSLSLIVYRSLLSFPKGCTEKELINTICLSINTNRFIFKYVCPKLWDCREKQPRSRL